MLKLILRVLFLIILGILAYDIAQTGSFNKSMTYKFLKEKRVIENGEIFIKNAKKSFNKTMVWAEKNIPVYYNQTCTYLKPYINLGQDLSLVFKNNAVSFIQHAEIYVAKNFPVFKDYMSIVLEDTISTAKEGAVAVSQNLQNYAEMVMQYVNNMLSQR